MAATISQKLGALLYILLFTAGFYCWIAYFCAFYYGGIITRTLLLLYTAYIWLPGLGRVAPTHGPDHAYFRGNPAWKKAAEYYPMTLKKTAELDPSKSYVFGFHPHGIISMSAFVAFATEGLNISKVFPGMTFHVLTLVQNFFTPFIRDVLLQHGMADCAKQTCINILKKGHGRAIVLCVGGAREALLAEQEQFQIVLGKRMGFVRIAVQTGSCLVPVISFGENNIFQVSRPEEKSFMATVQEYVQLLPTLNMPFCGTFYALFKYLLKAVGLGFPLFHGKGLLVSRVGVMPYQSPIRLVVGSPIEVPHVADVYSEEGKRVVAEAHAHYVKALRGLWDKYKNQYALNRKGTFKIVDLPPPRTAE